MSRQPRQATIRAIEHEIRTSQNQTDMFDEAVSALLKINRTDMRCLDIVERAGKISAGELASASGLSTGAVTAMIDRMENAGYLRRVRDTEDRRKVMIEMTSDAERVLYEIYAPLGDAYNRQVAGYTTGELELILDFLQRGREFAAQQLERVQRMTSTQSTETAEG